jgi:solute carrier family 12 sodium/potassium/chloride transporter 2
VDFCKNIQKYF